MNINVYNSCNQCGNDIKPKLNQNYHMNMKAWGCIEKFSFLNKVYLNKDEHELKHETFLQQGGNE